MKTTMQFERQKSVLIAGLCPILVLSMSLFQALSYSLVYLLVLLVSYLIIFAFRPWIPLHQRGAYTVLTTAAITSLAYLICGEFFPELIRVLGVFFPLIAIQATLLDSHRVYRLENTAGIILAALLKNALLMSGFLIVFAVVREILGNGTLSPFSLRIGSDALVIPGLASVSLRFLLESSAGFILLGLVLALVPESDTENEAT